MARKETIIFLTGMLTATIIIYSAFYVGQEVPLSSGLVSLEQTAPSNWVNEEAIKVYDNKVIIEIEGATISNYANTGSMKPLIDENSNGIRIKPKNSKEINIGDIISYQREGRMYIHRITATGIDEEGEYYITQGDNTITNEEKIRFEEIKYVTIGVIW